MLPGVEFARLLCSTAVRQFNSRYNPKDASLCWVLNFNALLPGRTGRPLRIEAGPGYIFALGALGDRRRVPPSARTFGLWRA